ncbi:MAG: FAD-binding protein [Minicystis sp.]
MSRSLPRRAFLRGSLAVAALVYFPETRIWASQPGPGGIHIPSLDGQLLTDAASLAKAADDFGHMIHHTPRAVLVPGSIHDIEKMVKFARQHDIQVAGARGLGESHGTRGQAQVEAGVVIDMSALDTIHAIEGDSVLVDAGVRWIDLLAATTPLGKSPPTLTDFIGLSVGGTLSVGGIGGQAFRHGLQVDNVIELEVVTGKGQLVTCSVHHKEDLFNAVRAGLGQFGIIVRARLRLVAVPASVRTYTAVYDDLATMTGDQQAAAASGHFDYIEGSAFFGATGWQYQIELARYFNPSQPPNDVALLANLHALPGTSVATDSSYFDFANRLAPTLAFLESIGALALPHPWMDLFVPGSVVVPYVESVLAQLTPADTGNGPILIYPFNRSKLTAPFLRVPDEAQSFLFAVLRFTVPPIPEVIAAQNAQNRAFFEANQALGGHLYPIDSFPFSQADWETHFGARWDDFEGAKGEFDPDNVLTPGQGIF